MSSITQKVLSLAACLAVAGLTTLAQAEEATASAEKTEAKVETKTAGGREARGSSFMLSLRAAKSLTLTDEQTSKIGELEKAYREKVQELRRTAMADATTTGAERAANRDAIREANRKLNEEFGPQLDAILTAEQKAEIKTKIEEMRAPRGPRGEGRRGPGQTDEQGKTE